MNSSPPPPRSAPFIRKPSLSSLLYQNATICAWLPKVACDRLRREFNVQVQTGRAYVAYREGISEETEM